MMRQIGKKNAGISKDSTVWIYTKKDLEKFGGINFN